MRLYCLMNICKYSGFPLLHSCSAGDNAGAFSLTSPVLLSLHSVCCSLIASLCFFYLPGIRCAIPYGKYNYSLSKPHLFSVISEQNFRAKPAFLPLKCHPGDFCMQGTPQNWLSSSKLYKKLVMNMTMQPKSSYSACGSASVFHLYLTDGEEKNYLLRNK